MKRYLMNFLILGTLSFSIVLPTEARADFFGGDLAFLAQLVQNSLQQLIQLRQLLGKSQDTLGLLRDVNEGVREAMGIMQTMNRTMQPGVLSQYRNPSDLLRAVQDIYGAIPQTSDAKLEQLNDQSVAEAVNIHNQAFEYADMVDPEAERIKDYARGVSPSGAGRLTAQSLGVLINVTNQVLRTNAAMLKLMSENLALQNRKEKLNSGQFKMQYEGLSSVMSDGISFKKAADL